MTAANAHVLSLFHYPVKSCAGISLTSAQLDDRGIVEDRKWMVVDAHGNCLTQRDLPSMALIVPRLRKSAVASSGQADTGMLELAAPGMPALIVPSQEGRQAPHPVSVWSDECPAIDEGSDVADWLSEFLGRPCRLVQMAPSSERRTSRKLPEGDSVKISFVDSCPLLLISQESLDDLNKRLPEPVPMNRFRPNVVVEGLGAFQEDCVTSVRVGCETLFRAKPCARCVLTTIDQSTANRGLEPLRTLSRYRTQDNKVLFGVYFLHRGPGAISVGDPVEIAG